MSRCLCWAGGLVSLVILLATPGITAGGKNLMYALSGAPESLDPAKATSVRAIHVNWHLCDSLLDISPDGKDLEPRLAESWVLSDDGREVVFTLRSGARFHDGTVVDAKAVKASFERQFRPDHALYTSEPKNAKEQMLDELIATIDVQDEQTVAMTLKYPGLHYLSQIAIISPAAAEQSEAFGRSPVCSGPFKFSAWSDEQISLSANNDYWAGRPQIDGLTFRFIKGSEATVDALLNGEIDFAPHITGPAFLERLQESPTVKLERVSGLGLTYLGFMNERPPFDNAKLRRAIVAAIDVPRMVLFLGRGTALAAKGPLPPAIKESDPEVRQAAYDPELAKQLLAEAAVEPGLTVRFILNDTVNYVAELAGAIKNDLERLGLKVELIGKPSWRDATKAVRAREGDMFIYGWNLRAPNPERLLMPLFHSRSIGTTNLTHYHDPSIDNLLDQVLQVPAGAEQRAMYSQIQQRIVADAPMVFLYHRVRVAAYSNRIQDLKLNLGGHPHDKLVNVSFQP